MEDQDSFTIAPIEYSARRFNDLAVPRSLEFRWPAAAFRVDFELLHMAKNSLN